MVRYYLWVQSGPALLGSMDNHTPYFWPRNGEKGQNNTMDQDSQDLAWVLNQPQMACVSVTSGWPSRGCFLSCK